MSSIDDAIEAVLQNWDWGTNERVELVEQAIPLAIKSGCLIPADQLKQVGWYHNDHLFYDIDGGHWQLIENQGWTVTPKSQWVDCIDCPYCLPVVVKPSKTK